MIEVSCRKDFHSTTEFSSHIVNTSPYPVNKKILIVVHGFNSPLEKVRKRYYEVEEQCELTGAFDEVVGFYWPGSWTHALGFINADKRAEKASVFLAHLILELVERGNNITVEGHSLGAKVCIYASHVLPKYDVERWVLVAAAVPNNIFETFNEFVHNGRYAPRIYFSKDDPVLKYAYRIVPYNWRRPALGYSGPDKEYSSLKIASDMTGIVKDHSGYMTNIVKLCS